MSGHITLCICIFLVGYWLFHCHIEYHVELGMAIVFKVGEEQDYPAVPPNFPRCSNYQPHLDSTLESKVTQTPIVYNVHNASSVLTEIEFDTDNTLAYLRNHSRSQQKPIEFFMLPILIIELFFIVC